MLPTGRGICGAYAWQSGAPGVASTGLARALLLHANVPVAAEALAEMVWDGLPSPTAVTTLRSYVRRLRRALGPEAAARVVARDPGYDPGG
jgi:DNA-binding SARP family transcriptional activator